MPAVKKISKKKVAKVNLKFILDCTQVAQDALLQPKNFSEFLQQKIKVIEPAQLASACHRLNLRSLQVQNKTGNLGDSVKVETDDKKVTVKSTIPLSKRYLKYLAKKYLKRNNVSRRPACFTCRLQQTQPSTPPPSPICRLRFLIRLFLIWFSAAAQLFARRVNRQEQV
jgi:hypothetical protein